MTWFCHGEDDELMSYLLFERMVVVEMVEERREREPLVGSVETATVSSDAIAVGDAGGVGGNARTHARQR
jgi:hypothetical protein